MPEPSDLPWWLKPGFGAWPAASVFQPNPGWTFGNVIVSARNSSAPDTEAEIVAGDSYGRQIGKLLDAVTALIDDPTSPKATKAFAELDALRERVEATKRDAAIRRVEQFLHDLEILKASGSPDYAVRLEELLAHRKN